MCWLVVFKSMLRTAIGHAFSKRLLKIETAKCSLMLSYIQYIDFIMLPALAYQRVCYMHQ